ncbi:hypothetical protein ACFSKM_16510 [Ancylobacter dichloromethanicus]
MELEDAARYHKALKAQMLFWVALLSLDFVAVVALIAGKALNWILVLPMPAHFEPLDLGWLLPAILYFFREAWQFFSHDPLCAGRSQPTRCKQRHDFESHHSAQQDRERGQEGSSRSETDDPARGLWESR